MFGQERVARNAGLFLEGLLGDEQRKTGWMRAEAAGDPGPWRQQAILGRRDWDADALRDIVRDYVIEHLADDDAVLVIDETAFSNRARRRGRGAAIHRFGRQDYELPDRRLRYLRFASWPCVHRSRVVSSEGMDRRSRSSGSHIRACRRGLCDQTKACDGNDCTRDSRGCAIQVGCCRYGLRCRRYRTATTPGRQRLCARSQQRSCVPIWGKRRSVSGTAADIASTRRSSDWKRLSAGDGTKGPRLHDWCYLELADLDAGQFNSANDGLWTRGLLIRRRIADDDLAFFTTWCRQEQQSKRWSQSKAIAGRSRTVLRPPKTSSGSITMRADPGMAGIATCLWRCSPSP